MKNKSKIEHRDYTGKPRILLAEDNIPTQKVAMAILKKYGFSADIANNGMEAVEALKKNQYDLVLMDMQMPEIDGIEATQIIRNPSSGVLNPDIPIVAMTANATKEDREKCLNAGMNDYISKPINPNEISSVINKLLNITVSSVTEKNTTDISTLNPEIFDCKELMNRLNRDESFIKSFIKDILNYISEEIKNIKAAAGEKNAEKIRLHSHSIKGMCANASAKKLSEAAYQIELIGKQGKSDIVNLLKQLEQEYEKFQSVISGLFPDILQISPEPLLYKQDKIIPEEKKELMPELIRRLEDEMIPKWSELTDVFYIDDVKTFAMELKCISKEYQEDILSDYSEKLYKAAADAHIDRTENLLAEFQIVVNKIKHCMAKLTK